MSAVLEPGINLRPMTDDDVDDVMAIETAVYEFPWTRGIFLDCLRVGYCCWVLEDGDEIVSYGVMSVAAAEAHILTIVVREVDQKRGLGRQMLLHLLSLARQRKVKTILLEVRPSNDAAIYLYQSVGFSEVGIRKDYYPGKNDREDALVMGLDLKTY
ncbi:MAG: ribosomal protein S18-alanine N-acetyltransferase [Gammaproteobacteria bacterium]|nr:ribosomal protein S18-alanine N-acetyltransferase [Gammaproteobacteria bacterium]MDH5776992.1 ribosomal protein S18-alanine N-acetyltransferase [Gammaproteobacteria bacterium]